jgi:hypothetical protein
MTVAKYPPAGGVDGVAAGLDEGHKMLLRIECSFVYGREEQGRVRG